MPFGIEPSQLAFPFSPLGMGWSYECDAFSLGCILVEFYTGVALYQTHDNLEHLAMMEMVMGRMPERFARRGTSQKAEYFKENYKLDWPPAKATKQSKKDVKATKSLEVGLARIGIVCILILTLIYSKSSSRSTITTGRSSTSYANCLGLILRSEYGCGTPSNIPTSAPRHRTIIHRTYRVLWILCCMRTCTEYDVKCVPLLDPSLSQLVLLCPVLFDRKSS